MRACGSASDKMSLRELRKAGRSIGQHHSGIQGVNPCTQEDENSYQDTGLTKLEQSLFMYIHLR